MSPVRLIDGTEVDSSSEAWRAECEARAVLAMPNKQRRNNYLDGYTDIDGRKQAGVLGRRGAAAVAKLRADVFAVWEFNRARA